MSNWLRLGLKEVSPAHTGLAILQLYSALAAFWDSESTFSGDQRPRPNRPLSLLRKLAGLKNGGF